MSCWRLVLLAGGDPLRELLERELVLDLAADARLVNHGPDRLTVDHQPVQLVEGPAELGLVAELDADVQFGGIRVSRVGRRVTDDQASETADGRDQKVGN